MTPPWKDDPYYWVEHCLWDSRGSCIGFWLFVLVMTGPAIVTRFL